MAGFVEFNQWLQKGLGRAVVYIKKHDPKPLRETVLHACTHNLTYDPQCEGDRETYLLDLIHACGDEKFFRNGLLEALTTAPRDPDTSDLGQTIALCRNFAEKGDTEMKEAMYNAVADAGFEREGYSYCELIKLDGLPALLIAAEHFPPTIPDDQLWQVGSLIRELQDRDGEEAADEAIRRALAESPRLAQMLEKSRVCKHGFEPRKKGRKRVDYATVKRMIAEKPAALLGAPYAGWGKTASEEELQTAAADLLLERDEARLLAYLSVFRFQPFPGPIARLLELAESSNIRLARLAVAVLSQLSNPEIRSLALRLLGTRGKQGDGVELLTNNYQSGDFRLIESRLREPMDVGETHHFEMGVRHLVRKYRQEEAEQCLLLLYEKGPCSLCRGQVVEDLIALNRLPEWMREECRYDSYTCTRKLM
jgi:hypothetical protein